MDFKILEPVTISGLICAIEAMQDNEELNEDEADDLEFSLFRLEATNSKDRLVNVNELQALQGYSIQEGYWVINGLAHYLCKTPRPLLQRQL